MKTHWIICGHLLLIYTSKQITLLYFEQQSCYELFESEDARSLF